jgi:zinc transporter ZupT
MLWMSFSELLPEAIHDAKKETVATLITVWILLMIVFQTLLAW